MTKFDVISDLHFTHHIKNTDKKIERFIIDKINPRSEYIIIAGDIANSIYDILSFFKVLKRFYKRIIFVFGNHDFYFTNSERKKFDSYIERQEYLKKELIKLNIDILDGNVIEIEGKKLGGSSSWYDFSYTKKIRPTMTNEQIADNWSYYMNDGNYIKGLKKDNNTDTYDSIQEFAYREKQKIANIYECCDIIVTHISPLNELTFVEDKYKYDTLTGAYFFDGMYFVEHTNAKYWIYGHTHSKQEFEVYDTKCIANPLGYPHEKNITKSIQIEV